MRAAVLTAHGEPPSYAEHPDPVAREGHVLVRITAAPVVPLDLLCASGTSYFGEPALPYVPGVQGVGVDEAGERVWVAASAGMRPGDGTLGGAYVAAPDDVVPVPGDAPDADRGSDRPVRGRRVVGGQPPRPAARRRDGHGARSRRRSGSGGRRSRRAAGSGPDRRRLPRRGRRGPSPPQRRRRGRPAPRRPRSDDPRGNAAQGLGQRPRTSSSTRSSAGSPRPPPA